QICGQLIPVDEYNEHLRIELLDPKYQENKKEIMANAKKVSIVHDSQIIQNLKEMQDSRPDIFGLSAEQFERSQIQQIQQGLNNKPIWDGQSATMTRTTATVAMLQQQQRRQYEDIQKKNYRIHLMEDKMMIKMKNT
ncbi:surp module family protein, putative, partial [Ichthyophthirius multifiliis]